MARGGYRPGAGRPMGSKTRLTADVVKAAKSTGMSPLDYMLSVMRDRDADTLRRDRMAVAAAPFCHPRISDNRFGKKDAAAEDAATAGVGTSWSADLEYGDRAN